MPEPVMSAAQRAYEEKRAKKAGKSLDAHLAEKRKRDAAEAESRNPQPVAPPKKPGLLSRLIERGHKPLK